MKNILFVTWDGPQTDYLEGLFLPIFTCLADMGFRFHIFQFTWGTADRIEKRRQLCEKAGIPYRSQVVLRRFGTAGFACTAVFGARTIRRAVRDWNIDTLMPRSLMPALAVFAMGRRNHLDLVFDADGFPADERVDFGRLSPHSLAYKILRKIEAEAVRHARVVLVRRYAAIPILLHRAELPENDTGKFHVVTSGRNCADYMIKRNHPQPDEITLCYAGSVGEQYCPRAMLEIAYHLKKALPSLRFRIFTAHDVEMRSMLENMAMWPADWIGIEKLPPEQMPAALMSCNLALSLRKKAFSTQGVSPIKIGEYLLAGLPIIGSPHGKEVDELISKGVFFPYEDGKIQEAVDWVIGYALPFHEELRQRCHNLGEQKYSLKRSVADYAAALQ